MKPIPDRIPLRIVMFGDGARGMALQVARNEEYGVQVDAKREHRGAKFVEVFTSDHIPDQTFTTFKALREAFNALEILPPPFKAIVVDVKPKGRGAGKCWLCRGEYAHDVRVKTGWRDGDATIVPVCDADLEAVKADPLAAIEARHQWVRDHPVSF